MVAFAGCHIHVGSPIIDHAISPELIRDRNCEPRPLMISPSARLAPGEQRAREHIIGDVGHLALESGA